jgi:hypothetical protein
MPSWYTIDRVFFFERGRVVRRNYLLSINIAVFAFCICCAPAAVLASKKKAAGKPAASATKPAAFPQPVHGVLPDAGEIDRRMGAAETEIAQLTATLTQLNQDSIRVAAEIATKLQASAGSQPLDEAVRKKTQELSALRMELDKARRDSIAALGKLGERMQGIKREAARLDAGVMAASNQLNVLSSRRLQVPSAGSGEGIKSAEASRRDLARIDSLTAMRQADLAAWGKRRDQLRQDSMALEAGIFEGRIKISGDGGRVDSLIRIAAAAMSESAAKQAKAREGSANNPDQARLNELSRQKFQAEAQIVPTRAEITASTVDRERLKVASVDADKKILQGRIPLSAALAYAESQIAEKAEEREALLLLNEKIKLDSAMRKAKDALNSAIEQRAMKKKGAEKLVNQREGEVSTLGGRLDDIVRKNPRVTQYESKLGGARSVAEKCARIETLLASVKAEIASLTARRDQAKQNLENFEMTHPATAKAWAPRLGQLDSTVAVKEKTLAGLVARRDSLESLMATVKRTVEGFTYAANAENRKADSAAEIAKKQWSDLAQRRAQARGDSMKNESALSVGLMRLRSEQAAVSERMSALDREIASSLSGKERLKQAIVDAQNREEKSKTANQAERNRLDSLIAAKEQEVTQLSMQNEKISQDFQSASRDLDQELQKQGAAAASIATRIPVAEQELIVLKGQGEAVRKDRAALEKACLDTLRDRGRNLNAVRTSLLSKKNEIAALRNQRGAMLQNLKGEIERLDDMVAAEGRSIAGLEAYREKIRRDSMTAESSKFDAALRSAVALKRHDSLIAGLRNQLTECSAAVEKARQDSIAMSAPMPIAALLTAQSLDSLIVIKEREIADLKLQREKANREVAVEKQKQSASLSGARQNIMNQRMIAQRKQADIASLQSQRVRLQQDSATALARIQSTVYSSGGEIARQNSIIAGKKEGLAAMRTQRGELAEKLKAMGAEPPVVAPVASSAAGGSQGNADTAQKLVEEIYMLIGSEKIDEAVARFNSGRSLLSDNINTEAFQVLKYAVEQAVETRKKSAEKK